MTPPGACIPARHPPAIGSATSAPYPTTYTRSTESIGNCCGVTVAVTGMSAPPVGRGSAVRVALHQRMARRHQGEPRQWEAHAGQQGDGPGELLCSHPAQLPARTR